MNPRAFAFVLASGALFGFGLSLSTMVKPEVVLGFLLGRDMGCHGRLKDPQVAMLHCQVIADQQGATLTDRGSTGGTFVESARIATHQLRQGDVFRLGDTRIRFE